MKGVYYKGKKFPFSYDNPNTGKLEFNTRDAVYIPATAADFLFATSPSDFVYAGEEEEAPIQSGIVCRKCGHVSLNRSEATKHQHQCKGLSDGDSLDGADAA